MNEIKYGLIPCENKDCDKRMHMHFRVPLCPIEPFVFSKAIAMHCLAFLVDMGLSPRVIEETQVQINSSELPETHEEDEAIKEALFPGLPFKG